MKVWFRTSPLRIGLGVVLITLLLGAVVFLPARNSPDLSAFPDLKDATLADRTIVDFGYRADGVVAYSYLGESVPEKFADAEVVELRGENSFTTLVAIDETTEDPTLTLTTRFYSQPAYALDADGSWRYLEYATTIEQAFRNRDMTLWAALREVIVRTAYADTLSPFSGAGDGYVGNSGFSQTFSFPEACDMSAAWSNARTAVTGDDVVYTASPMPVDSESSRVFDSELQSWLCTVIIRRAFLPFDTSALSSDATISAATLNVYAQTKSNGDNDGADYVTVSTSTQATHTQLVTADYDTAGPILMNTGSEAIDSGQRKDITSISTAAYTAFTLNSAGINAIKKSGQASTCTASTGITCFALREGHDATNNQVADDAVSSVDWYTSEQTDISNDPYLEITYTAPASAVAGGGLQIGSGGSLKVTGGGIKIR